MPQNKDNFREKGVESAIRLPFACRPRLDVEGMVTLSDGGVTHPASVMSNERSIFCFPCQEAGRLAVVSISELSGPTAVKLFTYSRPLIAAPCFFRTQ
jgi:hypothetical protein